MEAMLRMRQILGLDAALAAAGAGDMTTPVTHNGFTWTNFSTSSDRFLISNTGGSEFVDGPGTQYIKLKFRSSNYFSQNSTGDGLTGHFAVVGRCNTSQIETAVIGQGVILGYGNPIGDNGGPRWFPGVCLESFHGFEGNHLPNDTDTYSDRTLEENVWYLLELWLTESRDGSRYMRYRLSKEVDSEWQIERDTGDVLDEPPALAAADWSQGFAMGHVFKNELADNWTFEVEDVEIYWMPPRAVSTQVPTVTQPGDGSGGSLSLSGEMTWGGSTPKLKTSTADANFSARWAFQDSTGNPTSMVVIPGTGANQASLLATNSPNLGSAFRACSVGMFGNVARIETFGVNGDSSPDLHLRPGNTLFAFKTNSEAEFPRGLLLGEGATSAYSLRFKEGQLAKLVADTSNPTVTNRFVIQDYTRETTVTAIPGGSATQATFLATNSNNLAGNYRAATWGMFGNTAKIQTFGVGLSSPNFQVDAGGSLYTFTTGGQLQVPSSIKLGAKTAIGGVSGWSLSFSGTRWRSGSFNTDTFPTTVSGCADEIVGIKRVLAAMHDDLKAQGILNS